MNYWSRFGLEFNPFIKNVRNEVIVKTSSYIEVQSRLARLQDIKGFGLLTGNPGSGKTTAIRQWAKDMNPSQYKVIYIPMSTLTTIEFYKSLAMNLGLEPTYRKITNYHNIQNNINYLALEKRVTPVIILDEADSLNSSILCDLKMIFNFEKDSQDRAVVLLSGLPMLNTILNRSANEALRQRLIINYNMELLTKEEAEMYIKEKVKVAGGNEDIFTPQAINSIINASSGIMRNISKLCNACLMAADAKKLDHIDEELALAMISDSQLQ